MPPKKQTAPQPDPKENMLQKRTSSKRVGVQEKAEPKLKTDIERENDNFVYLKDSEYTSKKNSTLSRSTKIQNKIKIKQTAKDQKSQQEVEQIDTRSSRTRQWPAKVQYQNKKDAKKVEESDEDDVSSSGTGTDSEDEYGSDIQSQSCATEKINQLQSNQKNEEMQIDEDDKEQAYRPSKKEQQELGRFDAFIDKKVFKVNKQVYQVKLEDLEFIQKISNNYKLRFGDLKLRQYKQFESLVTDEYKSMKKWYHNRYSGLVKVKSGNFKIPAVQYPNEILMNLLSDSVTKDLKPYIAQILEEHLPSQLQSHYTSQALSSILGEVEKHSESIEELVEVLNKTPLPLRLKATAKAVQILQSKEQYSNDYKLSWFSHCIMPSLTVSGRVNYLEFEKSEIASIKEICEFCNPYQMNEDQAYAYLKLLKGGNVLELDLARKHFIDKPNEFWQKVLQDICGLHKEVAEIWTQHKQQMISDAMYTHQKHQSMSKEFATTISRFQRLASTEISELFQISHQKGFQMLVALLQKGKYHDFQDFKTQSAIYLRLDNPSQIEACKQYLAQTSLDQWGKYQNQIMASSAIHNGEEALNILKKSINKMMNMECLPLMDESIKSKLGQQFDSAFLELNEKIILQKFDWQEELVVQLLHLITRAQKKNIIVTLCTGHGKSVIIQLLADMLVQVDDNVIIVCMNEFLAYQGRSIYGSKKVLKGSIIYMSIHDFLKMTPNKRFNVIFDEIDSMVGVNSFRILIKEFMAKPVYNTSLMRQWKSVIGFSGTISQSTTEQLISELKDPICLDIPSLRINGNNNKLMSIVKVADDHQLFNAIESKMKELKSQYSNFIVVFENKQILDTFRSTSAFIDASSHKNSIIFDDFSQSFASLMHKLDEVAEDNFLIMTTKEGARGVDYKGINPAHVIIAFSPESYSECVQTLGRGCRELSSFAEGTIICQDPLTLNASKYLSVLQAADGEISEAMKINCKLARTFHGCDTKTEPLDQDTQQAVENFDLSVLVNHSWPQLPLLMLEQLMKRGKNIKRVQNGDLLWDQLKKLDVDSQMPVDLYEQWNQ